MLLLSKMLEWVHVIMFPFQKRALTVDHVSVSPRIWTKRIKKKIKFKANLDQLPATLGMSHVVALKQNGFLFCFLFLFLSLSFLVFFPSCFMSLFPAVGKRDDSVDLSSLWCIGIGFHSSARSHPRTGVAGVDGCATLERVCRHTCFTMAGPDRKIGAKKRMP